MNRLKNITLAFAGTVVRITLIIFAIICISTYAKKAYDFGYRIFAEEPMSPAPGRDISLTVSGAESQKDIAQMLEDKGIIRDHTLFTIQKKLSIYKDDIKPGSYTLNTSMTSDEILAVLVGEKTEGDEDGDMTDEFSEEVDPLSDDITGLETAGVLGEEGQYDEAAAFEDTEESTENAEDEFEGEGDEESAIEE